MTKITYKLNCEIKNIIFALYNCFNDLYEYNWIIMIDRIKQVMDYSQLSTTAFADTIGISRSGLTHLLTGRNQPSLDVARKILAKFPDISTEWLIMGMGDMFRSDNQEITLESTPAVVPAAEEHPAENSKIGMQSDLFNEYGATDDSEEDVVDPPHTQPEVEVEDNSVPEPILVPQPLPTSNPEPAAVPSQVARTRTRTAPAQPVRRDKNAGNNTEKKLQRIVFFYDDHSFEVFNG